MAVLTGLKPEKVFSNFELLCSVPHGSGNTKQISDLIVNWARERGLAVHQDAANNVIIRREASAGREQAPPVILQGHIDMVCACEPDCGIDMSRDGLKLLIDGDWIRARGTTLGGDNGIAVAIVMAILDDETLSLPRIEAVFTTDEETGMDGARALDVSLLTAKTLVNLDSEEEGYLTVSCAGGVRVDCRFPADREALPPGFCFRTITVEGLRGGHSGVEIDKGRANAIRLMGRFLWRAARETELRLCSLSGGNFSNVIPLFCTATVALPEKDAARLDALCREREEIFRAEYDAADPNLRMRCEAAAPCASAASLRSTGSVLRMLLLSPLGVQAMSMDIPGLVQTSLNLGVAVTGEEDFLLRYSVRSSLQNRKEALVERLRVLCELLGGELSAHDDYPGWAFRRESPLRDALAASCRKVLGREPQITATHGGLECGIFADRIPGLDCVSLGPDLFEVHSVRERLSISSTARLYDIVCDFLENWQTE